MPVRNARHGHENQGCRKDAECAAGIKLTQADCESKIVLSHQERSDEIAGYDEENVDASCSEIAPEDMGAWPLFAR